MEARTLGFSRGNKLLPIHASVSSTYYKDTNTPLPCQGGGNGGEGSIGSQLLGADTEAQSPFSSCFTSCPGPRELSLSIRLFTLEGERRHTAKTTLATVMGPAHAYPDAA